MSFGKCVSRPPVRIASRSLVVRHVQTFFSDEAGATAIEYALIASLIAIALVVILTNLGTQLSAEFSEVSSAIK